MKIIRGQLQKRIDELERQTRARATGIFDRRPLAADPADLATIEKLALAPAGAYIRGCGYREESCWRAPFMNQPGVPEAIDQCAPGGDKWGVTVRLSPDRGWPKGAGTASVQS